MFNAPLARNQISPPSVSIKNEPFSPTRIPLLDGDFLSLIIKDKPPPIVLNSLPIMCENLSPSLNKKELPTTFSILSPLLSIS